MIQGQTMKALQILWEMTNPECKGAKRSLPEGFLTPYLYRRPNFTLVELIRNIAMT